MTSPGTPPRPVLTDRVFFVVLGMGFKALADIALTIALARLLSRTDFGTFRQVLLVYATLVAMLSVGLPTSLSYFIPRAGRGAARSLAYRTLAMLVVASLAGVAVLLVVRGPLARSMNNPVLAPLLLMASLYPLCQTLNEAFPHLLIALDRHRAAGAFSAIQAVLQMLSVLIPLLLGAHLEGLVLSATGGSLVNLMLGMLLIRRVLGSFHRERRVPSMSEQLRYALPLGVGTITLSLYPRIDRFLISLAYPPATLAVYAVGATELPLVPMFPHTVGRALLPHYVTLHREGRVPEILRIWHRSIVKIGLLLLPVFVLCFTFAPQIMRLLYGPEYVEASTIFRLYLLLLPLRPTAYGAVLQALGETRAVLRGSLLAVLLNVSIGLGLIPVFGWIGPALGAVAAVVVLIVYYMNRIARTLACPWSTLWPWRRYFIAIGVTAFSALIALPALWLPFPRLFGTLAFVLTFLTVYAVLLKRFGEIGKEEIDFLRRWLSLRALQSS